LDVIERIADLRRARAGWSEVGLVPTMGYLHEGHVSLLRAARSENRVVVMSLFVNPTQFGPNEDFASYPRDMPRDLRVAEEAGTDVVFMPSTAEVYPPGFDTWVEVGGLTSRWEAEHRPGHFRGVATVVMKLFQAVQPDRAYFGEKDYQQLLVIRKMVADLWLPLEIVGCPTIREPSGLALSSRNAYFAPDMRARAAVLSRALARGQELARNGVGDVDELKRAMLTVLSEEPSAELDYLAVVNAGTLEPIEHLAGEARVLAAMRFGGVHLIDNVPLLPPPNRPLEPV
jgi:pantoate--beta-alanine ligase